MFDQLANQKIFFLIKNAFDPKKINQIRRKSIKYKEYQSNINKINQIQTKSIKSNANLSIPMKSIKSKENKSNPNQNKSIKSKQINKNQTYPNKIKYLVKRHKVNLGISLDGDADRIILCDEKGNIIDGDHIIAMLASRWKRKKILKGGVIGTLMSNYGLQNYFRQEKIRFIRAKVGDKHVKEQMKKNRFNLGGEQSGHIILGKFATTGDGLLVALEVLFSMKKGKKASELFNIFKSTPQVLENVVVKDKSIINSTKCKKAIKVAKRLIKNRGRLLVRKSGTESKIRIMVESDNKKTLHQCVNMVKRAVL